MKKIIASHLKWISVILWFLSSSCAFADAAGPLELLQSVTQEVLSELKTDQVAMKENLHKVQILMNRVMLPHVDIEGMSRWVVGRTAWTQATTAEQQAFIAQFRHLILNTYANTLSEYHDQRIEYLPMREAVDGKERVQVMSIIHEPGKESINVVYRLVKKENEWKVYDIIIEGVSLLRGFQAQFSEDIQTKGLNWVIHDLQRHNDKVDASDDKK